MRCRLYKIKLALVALVIAACFAQAAFTQSKSELSAQEKRGQQIYLKGEAAGEITALLGSDQLEVPASALTCANCHGLRGEGTKEGGIQPPPIDWKTLTQSHTSALTRRERKPYTEETLARAISRGLSPDGTTMHPAMPRYVLTREQMADLIAYLKKLDKESIIEPGLTNETIRVGAALPMTGPMMQIGEDIKATLNATLAQVNSQGGVYSRRIELVVEDSRGEAAQTLEATRRLIEEDKVFALVGSFEPGESSATNALIKAQEIPLIGPVTLSPKNEVPPNRYVFYLLPTFADQARALVDFICEKMGNKQARAAVIYANNDFNLDALAGLKSQSKLYGMEIVSEQGYAAGGFEALKAVKALASQRPDCIFFFGGAEDARALAAEMEQSNLKIPLLSSVVMLGRGAFSLPASIAAQTFLSYPSQLPTQEDFAEFIAAMQKSGVALRSPAFQAMAYAAIKIFLEAMKSSGKRIDRATLISALEGIQDFRTGVVPPVTFGPNRRVGSNASYIVGIESGKMQYLPLTERRLPKEKP